MNGDKGAVFSGNKQVGAFLSWTLDTVTTPMTDGSDGLRREIYNGWTASAKESKFVTPPEGDLKFMFFFRGSWKEATGRVVTKESGKITMGGTDKITRHRPEE